MKLFGGIREIRATGVPPFLPLLPLSSHNQGHLSLSNVKFLVWNVSFNLRLYWLKCSLCLFEIECWIVFISNLIYKDISWSSIYGIFFTAILRICDVTYNEGNLTNTWSNIKTFFEFKAYFQNFKYIFFFFSPLAVAKELTVQTVEQIKRLSGEESPMGKPSVTPADSITNCTG